MNARVAFLTGIVSLGCFGEESDVPPPPTSPVAPVPTPTPPSVVPEPPAIAPAGYPAGFPFIAGGTMGEAPAGPAWLAPTMVTYAAHAPTDLRDTLRARLVAEGWTIQGEETSPRGTLRMQASKEQRQIQVSVLPGPDGQGSALLLVGR